MQQAAEIASYARKPDLDAKDLRVEAPDRAARGGARVAGWQGIVFAATLLALGFGGALRLLGHPLAAGKVWAAGTLIVLAAVVPGFVRGLWLRRPGVDVIAVLAMAGALALWQPFAGVVLAVMLMGGNALERFAVARAHRELTALLARAPRTANRRVGEDVIAVDVSELVPGDVALVRPGEVVPADGLLASGGALLDESALTGEARPVERARGEPIRSGGTNAGAPFELRVTAAASASTYAGIVRLVRQAEQSRAPLVRLADRYALWFIGFTLVLAGTGWLVSGDATRALAVLVVATPCPLILAAPAALVAGVSRAARHGIIVKGGGPLETLARVRVLLIDKTGTVTTARPQVVAIEPCGRTPVAEVLRLAASLEQVSFHPYGAAILAEAGNLGLALEFPADVREEPGTGIAGSVGGHRVAVGQLRWAAPGATATPVLRAIQTRSTIEGSASVYVAVDGELEGALLLQDPIRPEAPRALRQLREAGIRRIHLLTGDHPDVAELVGDALGVDRVLSERTPGEKVEAVRLVRVEGVTAVVGDGINDAPALALSDLGVAMGARGASAASEAADVVLTADRLDGLVLAVRIAQRTRRIALGSIFAGMGLSVLAMGFAAAGLLAPVAGALLQEVIDLLVLLNALRALGGGGLAPRRPAIARELADTLRAAHRTLRPRLGELAALASRLDTLPADEARPQLDRVRELLERELLPHEREEQKSAYPVLARLLDREDPTGPLVQTHNEIHRLARLYARLLDQLPADGPGPEDVRGLRRALYGLHAILSLHFAQEDELYTVLEA